MIRKNDNGENIIIKNIKFLSAFSLKLIAIIFMFCDHLWATVIPGNKWLTNIGRMAFPIFAFQITEGFKYTNDFKKYFLRMLIFAIISEVPFNLMYGGSIFYPFQQNVLFTFCIALLFLNYMEKAKNKNKKSYIISCVLSIIFGFLIGTILMVDYFGFGILMVFIFYWFKDIKYSHLFQFIGMVIINCFMMKGQEVPFLLFNHEFFFPLQAYAICSLIFIWSYNGKKGYSNKFVKYLFYIFYPLHMLILSIIWLYIIN